ncbi:hypothetical protein ACFC0X_25050 [Paenibacillus chitinolyticus]|uniref:hypothetical protein n=1 Tax=Paenibacillus chitinolyticus TaxID=79263 RepID=UPI0035DAF1E8
MNPWPYVRHRPPIIQREFRGENRLDPLSISPEYATETRNFTSSAYPALTVRPGHSVIGEITNAKVLGMGVWKDTELHAVFSDGTWRRWTGSIWSNPLASGLNTTAKWSFCNFKGNLGDFNLLGANGIDAVKKYDGSTVSNLSGAPANANFIDEHDNRLYCVTNGTQVHFSELSVATNWTAIEQSDSDPGSFIKEINSGKKISGMKAGAGHITVFFTSASFELYGTSASDFRMIEVAPDIGMLNNESSALLDGILYFISERGFYRYGGGSRPDKGFSAPMQWYIDNMNKAARQTCCAGTDGKRVYFAIPMYSATPDTIIEFTPEYGTWYVWRDVAPSCFARMGDNWYIGDNAGRLLQIGGANDNGSAIAWKWISKPFSAQSMSQVIRWLRAWISAKIPAGSAMNVYLSKSAEGDDDWTLVQNIPATGWISSKPMYIRSSVAVNAHFIRLKIEGTGPMKLHEFAREEDYLPLR